MIIIVGLGIVFGGGMVYLEWYKVYVFYCVGYLVYEYGKIYLLIIYIDYEGIWIWICECIIVLVYVMVVVYWLIICIGFSFGIVKV